jgi:uncharacterized protein (TIGR00297 family)
MWHLAYIGTLPADPSARQVWLFSAVSILFAVFGRLLRGVTAGGAIAGSVVCFGLLVAAGISGFAVLLTVFALTLVCTRIGYSQKQRLGTAEAGTGRDALQVIANLGVALVCATVFAITKAPQWLVAMGAALAEAAADTVSSEIGQAIGSQPRLITNWKRVGPGTNGGITPVGTAAGLVAAGVVAVVFRLTGTFGWPQALVCAGAGVVGMIADSVLGATLERKSLLGNNEVNFISTVVAAVTTWLLLEI